MTNMFEIREDSLNEGDSFFSIASILPEKEELYYPRYVETHEKKSSGKYLIDKQEKIDFIIKKIEESKYEFKDVIIKHLFHWIEVVSEEDDEDLYINLKSLEQLKDFIDSGILKKLHSPTMVLGFNGILSLQWSVEKNKKFLAVEFFPNKQYNYVLFSPSIRNENSVNRASSFCDKKELNKIINNIDWI